MLKASLLVLNAYVRYSVQKAISAVLLWHLQEKMGKLSSTGEYSVLIPECSIEAARHHCKSRSKSVTIVNSRNRGDSKGESDLYTVRI
jgi:hypothetical protein